jgi:hypothetical protein
MIAEGLALLERAASGSELSGTAARWPGDSRADDARAFTEVQDLVRCLSGWAAALSPASIAQVAASRLPPAFHERCIRRRERRFATSAARTGTWKRCPIIFCRTIRSVVIATANHKRSGSAEAWTSRAISTNLSAPSGGLPRIALSWNRSRTARGSLFLMRLERRFEIPTITSNGPYVRVPLPASWARRARFHRTTTLIPSWDLRALTPEGILAYFEWVRPPVERRFFAHLTLRNGCNGSGGDELA